MRQFRQLYAASAVHKRMRKRRTRKDVTKKHLPLHLERVIELGVVWNVSPLIAELEGIRQVWIPHRPRRIHAVLDLAIAQPNDCAALRSINMQIEELIAVNARSPR